MKRCGLYWLAILGNLMIRNGQSHVPLRYRWAAAIRNLVGRLPLAWILPRPTRFAYRLTIYTARRIP